MGATDQVQDGRSVTRVGVRATLLVVAPARPSLLAGAAEERDMEILSAHHPTLPPMGWRS